MEGYNIYRDIATRTEGDIYIGVVGPVRTGKSTFIKKFMDLMVLPAIQSAPGRERARDELPQSAGGRTVMTTEPKFIPNEAVEITLSQNATMNVRMIDCVGYMVNGALGGTEEGQPRMVRTPWSATEIPFDRAAEIGTEKVIRDHSTIGIVVTTDGTITEIPREGYIPAEERVINELTGLGKPFVILLNSTAPRSSSCTAIRQQLEEKYSVPVLPVNCQQMDETDINAIIESVLFEFPLSEISINLPDWITSLDDAHYVKNAVLGCIRNNIGSVCKVNHISRLTQAIEDCEYLKSAESREIDLGTGRVVIDTDAPDRLFYTILSESTGLDIPDAGVLMTLMQDLASAKQKYDRLEYALHQVNETGYGIVSPSIDELRLEEPEIVKQGGRFGVRLRASAPSIHMIRADIETEVSPVVGSEKQSQELVEYLLSEFEVDPQKIWESNIFGKSLYDLVNAGLHNKLGRMPDDARVKLRETLQRIINEGSGGLICIIL